METERRAPQPIILQPPPEPSWMRWAEVLAPSLVMVAGGLIAWGGLTTQMDQMAESLADLRPLPLQVERLRGEMQQQIAAITVAQATEMAGMGQRLATVEQRSQRNYENIQQLWEIARANQAYIRQATR